MNSVGLVAERKRFESSFLRMAKDRGVSIHPVQDQAAIQAGEHLYEERGEKRWFIVDLAEGDFDGFVNPADQLRPVDILYLFAPTDSSSDRKAWQLYESWMVARKSTREIEAMIDDARRND